MFFMNDNREKIKADNPEIKFTEIAKVAGAQWKELSAEDKQPRGGWSEEPPWPLLWQGPGSAAGPCPRPSRLWPSACARKSRVSPLPPSDTRRRRRPTRSDTRRR